MKTPTFLSSIAHRLERYLEPHETVLAAFSGGPDSVALVSILRDLGYNVLLAYVNHNLRGLESTQEAEWVIRFAKRENFPLCMRTLEREELEGKSGLQAIARQRRYEWMEKLLHENGLRWGTTAHTWDDQMETFLYHLVRGSSWWGWKGIPFRRGVWLRPLLLTTRADLLSYLHQRHLSYVLDSTNYTPKYLRNQLRWWVLPSLYRINPSLHSLWKQRASLARHQRHHLNKLYQRWEARSFRPMPYGEAIVHSLPKDAFYIILKRRWRLSFADLNRLWLLWKEKRSGALYQKQDYLYVRTPNMLQRGSVQYWNPSWPLLELPQTTSTFCWGFWYISVGEGRTHSPALIWDHDKLLFPLRLRLWKEGDRLAPAGLGGHTKKVSDIWQEIGFYGFERRHAFVIEDARGHLIGAVGYRPSWDTAPTERTLRTFYLRAKYGCP